MLVFIMTAAFVGVIVCLEECFGLGTSYGLRGNGVRDL